jgi:hypothetical protein
VVLHISVRPIHVDFIQLLLILIFPDDSCLYFGHGETLKL